MIIESKTQKEENILIDFNGVFAITEMADGYTNFICYGGTFISIPMIYTEAVRLLKLDRQDRGMQTWNPDDKIVAPGKKLTEVGIYKFSLQIGKQSINLETNFLINTQEFNDAIVNCAGVESFGYSFTGKNAPTENKYRETIFTGALFDINDICKTIELAITNYININYFGVK